MAARGDTKYTEDIEKVEITEAGVIIKHFIKLELFRICTETFPLMNCSEESLRRLVSIELLLNIET